MSIPLTDCFSLCYAFYVALFFFSVFSLIKKYVNTSEECGRATIPRNFLWIWATRIITIILIFSNIHYLYKNDVENINILWILPLGALPLIQAGVLTFLWRFRGPVFVVSDQEIIIEKCKFLYRFSWFQDINYDSFECIYFEKSDFTSTLFEQITFKIKFDVDTVNQLYQKIIFPHFTADLDDRYKIDLTKYCYWNIQDEIEKSFIEIWKKHQTALEVIDLEEDQGEEVLETIKQDFLDFLKINHQIEAVITKISFERIGKNLDNEIVVV